MGDGGDYEVVVMMMMVVFCVVVLGFNGGCLCVGIVCWCWFCLCGEWLLC